MTTASDSKILVLLTCSSLVEAETIIRHLLSQRLIACAQVGTHVRSYYRWQGREEESTEYPVTLKTSTRCFDRLEQEVRRLHSYQVPEIVAVPMVAASQPYLQWMDENLAGETPEIRESRP